MRTIIEVDELGLEMRKRWDTYFDGEENLYRLPPIFYYDHRNRDLPCGIIVAYTKTYVEVSMTISEAYELLSDADYYTKGYDSYEQSEMRSLISSAKSTIKTLAKYGIAYVSKRGVVNE